MAHRFPQELLKLIGLLKKWPGVGTRTAERFAFELLKWDPTDLQALGQTLLHLQEQVPPCPTCGCLADQGRCTFCANRDTSQLCLLASARDAYAIEETGQYRGLYHVIEHLLSPLDGRHANTLRVDRIEKRIEDHQVREVIIAFDSTLEGDTTALYLKNHLSHMNLSISRLAFGLPVGSSLEHIDGGTLARSFAGRQTL
ncbi:MAG: recombination mediator RecR [Verrucomicrobia bacterium]|nr:recombination mediator RecR [Verrucomicrobiota bacterium]MDE3047309.1 recombination mediator RecR [Verrucomicrobiota bacterium]